MFEKDGTAHVVAQTDGAQLPVGDDLRLVGRAHAFLANPHGSLGHLEEALRHAARALAVF